MHKVAFSIGSLAIHWYGLLAAAGFMLGSWTAGRRGERYGLDRQTVLDSTMWIVIGVIVGSRLFYCITYWDEMMQNPAFPSAPWLEIFMLRRGGLVFYGGLVGSVVAVLLFTWHRGVDRWQLGDALAPSGALGAAFGRFGCLMSGCCYGRPTDLPWAIHFPADHPTAGIGVHPCQLYDAFLSLCLYAFLAWVHQRKKFDGQVFCLLVMIYPINRSLVEFFRGDYGTHYVAGTITPAHWLSLVSLALGAFFYWYLRDRGLISEKDSPTDAESR
ncbi:MAG: prolipoprotein diacylglyceryl transferase [Vulcanimicrobiota bacterium]